MAVVSAIATVAAVAGGTASAVQAQKAQKLDNQIRLQRLRRQRVKQIREARIRRAQVANIAAQTGTGGASAAISARGQTITEAARNVSFLDTVAGLSRRRSAALGRSQLFSSLAGTATQIGAFAQANPSIFAKKDSDEEDI